MSTVRELMNDWGRGFIAAKYGADYHQSGADIIFEEESESWQGCETCGDYGTNYSVTVLDPGTDDYYGYTQREYNGSMIELIDEMSRGGY